MKIIIGTHHKTGTNFFVKFLRGLQDEQNVYVWDRGSRTESQIEPPHWNIYFDHWCKWIIDIDSIDFRGIHSIRHPMGLIYSAALYHCRAKESWLHVKNKRYNGNTYAQTINSLSSIEERLIFEMRNASRNSIYRMLEVRADTRFFDVRLENISHDPEMTDLRKAFDFCKISEGESEIWIKIARKFSLRSATTLPKHSTTGVNNDWKQYFNGEVEKIYRQLFGDAEIRLGYEVN